MLKTIAIYLPQFHEVKENNRWWGEGFTDWVTVKNARPLYQGHREPRVPLEGNYYDLSDHDVMQWQAELASRYGVSGFCFYHYWFKDGRRILEKPAENLLAWTDIHMPFCFSWANQTWARTWTNVPNMNTWTGACYEKKGQDEGILLRQSYGGKKEWKEHFEYLLPFFKDSRYIQYDGKPVFLIHKPEYMYCLDNMMEYWKELAVLNGLKGICVITVRSNSCNYSQADYWLLQEYDYSFMPRERVYQNGVWTIRYRDAWENILERAYGESDENTFFGAFTDSDDTPRRGSQGVSVADASPQAFEEYYKKLARLAKQRGRGLIFINAWNEWGEGAYMEPDELWGYGYLEAVKKVMDELNRPEESRTLPEGNGMLPEESGLLPKESRMLPEGSELSPKESRILPEENHGVPAKEHGRYLLPSRLRDEKLRIHYGLLSRWMTNNEKGRRIALVLSSLHIHTIAIYGMGDLGRHLAGELETGPIQVAFGFDKKSEFLKMEDPGMYIRERYPDLDAVIVTPVVEYKEIRTWLGTFFDVPVISLEELIAECEIL